MQNYQTAAERIELLKTRISKAQAAIQLNRRDAKANIERQAKAEWAISLCACQVVNKCLDTISCIIWNCFTINPTMGKPT